MGVKDGVKEGRVTKAKKVRDPNAPKRGPNQKFQRWLNYFREYVLTHPVNKDIKNHRKLLQKEAGLIFKALSEDEKMQYDSENVEPATVPKENAAENKAAKKTKKK
jgi:CO dehydrogenase/acetyl-CoA synthase alpha subunit